MSPFHVAIVALTVLCSASIAAPNPDAGWNELAEWIARLSGDDVPARRDSAEDFSRLNALLCTAMGWIFIPAYCFAVP